MLIRDFVFGPIQTNCYLVACAKTLRALVIDPDIRTQPEKQRLFEEIDARRLELKYIVNTHHHFDHTGGNAMLKQATNARILIHELDAPVLREQWRWLAAADKTRKPACPMCRSKNQSGEIHAEHGKVDIRCPDCGFAFEVFPSPPADRILHGGDAIEIGEVRLLVIHTPGHSPGSICLHAQEDDVLFSGDTLFRFSIGRTDLIGGSYRDIIRSGKKLLVLPEPTVVYTGHGPATTIGEEKQHNAFFQD